MKESTFFVSLFIAIMLPASYAFSQSPAPEVNAIEHLLLTQAEAWNAGNIAGYMEGYWKSDSLLFTSGGNIQRGWKATFEKYKKSYNTPSAMGTLTFSGLEISLLSSTSAWVFGRWELQRKKDHPSTKPLAGGLFTLLLKKFPEGWKIIHDHTSSFAKTNPPKKTP